MLTKSAWVEGTSIVEGNVFKRREIELPAISEIWFSVMSKVTYDECFLIIKSSDGREISAGEMDPKFGEIVKLLKTHLPGFEIPQEQPGGDDQPSAMLIWKQ